MTLFLHNRTNSGLLSQRLDTKVKCYFSGFENVAMNEPFLAFQNRDHVRLRGRNKNKTEAVHAAYISACTIFLAFNNCPTVYFKHTVL